MPYYGGRLFNLARTLGVMAIATAACQGRAGERGAEPPPASPPVAPPMATPLIGEPAPVRPVLSVKLIDPGREPRRPLRYTSAPGTRQRVHLEATGNTDVEIGGLRSYSQQDADTDAWYTIEVVAARGDQLECEVAFERAEVIDWTRYVPGRINDLRRPLDLLRNYRYRFTVDRRGIANLPMFELPPELDTDRDRDLVWAITTEAARAEVALPDEPVGVGARWLTDEDDRGRMIVAGRWTNEIELVAIRGQRLELAIKREYQVPPQLLRLEARTVTGVSTTKSLARGHAVVDLGRLQPIEWRSETEFEFAGLAAELTEQTTIRVKVASSEGMSNR